MRKAEYTDRSAVHYKAKKGEFIVSIVGQVNKHEYLEKTQEEQEDPAENQTRVLVVVR